MISKPLSLSGHKREEKERCKKEEEEARRRALHYIAPQPQTQDMGLIELNPDSPIDELLDEDGILTQSSNPETAGMAAGSSDQQDHLLAPAC